MAARTAFIAKRSYAGCRLHLQEGHRKNLGFGDTAAGIFVYGLEIRHCWWLDGDGHQFQVAVFGIKNDVRLIDTPRCWCISAEYYVHEALS
jgi:hypothetical protein